jgi:addiction module HigA family antidote
MSGRTFHHVLTEEPQKMTEEEPIHPGKFLAEILAEEKLTQAQFARVIGVSAMRVSHIIRGSRALTAELALRFGKAFDPGMQTVRIGYG